MKLNRILLPVALAAVLAAAPGCKKEDTSSKNLEGYLSIQMPCFIEAGDSKTFMIDTMMTLICPTGEPIGYFFYDDDRKVADTLVRSDGTIVKHHYTYTAPDKTEDLTLTLGAFMGAKSAYAGTRASTGFSVVIPGITGGSITGFDESYSWTFTDTRDWREYYCTYVNGLECMRHNLAWDGAGRAYEGCEVMTDVFGRYYSWEEAQTACPDGWRLPTDEEWTALAAGAEAGEDIPGLAGRMMGKLSFNGTRMWEYWPEVKITDDLLFTAMPAGYCAGDVFDGLYTYATFWTSDEEDGLGICRYIYQEKDIVYRGRMPKTGFYASVRCVRE